MCAYRCVVDNSVWPAEEPTFWIVLMMFDGARRPRLAPGPSQAARGILRPRGTYLACNWG